MLGNREASEAKDAAADGPEDTTQEEEENNLQIADVRGWHRGHRLHAFFNDCTFPVCLVLCFGDVIGMLEHSGTAQKAAQPQLLKH